MNEEKYLCSGCNPESAETEHNCTGSQYCECDECNENE